MGRTPQSSPDGDQDPRNGSNCIILRVAKAVVRAADAQILTQVLLCGDAAVVPAVVLVFDTKKALEDGHGDAGTEAKRQEQSEWHCLQGAVEKALPAPAKTRAPVNDGTGHSNED